MVSNRITEGVGKKIVEALKQQSDIEIQNVVENPAPVEEEQTAPEENEVIYNEEEPIYENDETADDSVEETETSAETSIGTPNFGSTAQDFTNKFSNPHIMNFSQPAPIQSIMDKESFASELDGFEIPTNIAVLKQLINQLPAGVSRQTGAQIIKQTMEALGISMKSVLQEAQQVQESLNNSARECQTSILEYKKQINVLEKQSQKFQRQYSALNDIISLFVQTSL